MTKESQRHTLNEKHTHLNTYPFTPYDLAREIDPSLPATQRDQRLLMFWDIFGIKDRDLMQSSFANLLDITMQAGTRIQDGCVAISRITVSDVWEIIGATINMDRSEIVNDSQAVVDTLQNIFEKYNLQNNQSDLSRDQRLATRTQIALLSIMGILSKRNMDLYVLAINMHHVFTLALENEINTLKYHSSNQEFGDLPPTSQLVFDIINDIESSGASNQFDMQLLQYIIPLTYSSENSAKWIGSLNTLLQKGLAR